MFKLKLLAIIAIGVLMWFLPGYALEQANRLEQDAFGGLPEHPIPRPETPQPKAPCASVREIDDIEPPDIKRVPDPDGGPDLHVPVSAENRAKQRYAGMWRHVSTATQDRWWYLPVGLTVLLVLSKTTNLFKRRSYESLEHEAMTTETSPADKLDIEALLIELEKLRQAKLAEPGKEVQGEKRIVDS